MSDSNAVWTVSSILSWIEDYLAGKGDENPRLSARWLVSDALGLSFTDLYTHFDQPLTGPERDVLREYTHRRGQGEPLQYITGTTDFRFITLDVAPDVLIPRPETEVLVSEALSLLPSAPEVGPMHMRILDVCTGSGCIACSIASELPYAEVSATDISKSALDLARRNVEKLGLADRVSVYEGDLCAPIIEQDPDSSFDLIISNPPYVPTEVMEHLNSEVTRFEPLLALDGGDDGLDVFRRLCPQAYSLLAEYGGFAVELHETCLQEAAHIAEDEGFIDINIIDDLAGRPRVLCARKG